MRRYIVGGSVEKSSEELDTVEIHMSGTVRYSNTSEQSTVKIPTSAYAQMMKDAEKMLQGHKDNKSVYLKQEGDGWKVLVENRYTRYFTYEAEITITSGKEKAVIPYDLFEAAKLLLQKANSMI